MQTQPLPPELPAADHFLLRKRTKPKSEILPSFSQKIGILKTISQGVGLPPSPLDSFILHPKGLVPKGPLGQDAQCRVGLELTLQLRSGVEQSITTAAGPCPPR